MTIQYLLHPRAPLMFGTGAPAGFGVGGETLSFPWPATAAGAMRAAMAAAAGDSPNPYNSTYADVCVGPPLLAQLDGAGEYTGLLLPRPADAVYIGGEVVPLRPVKRDSDSYIDLHEQLWPLVLEKPVKEKLDESPSWWTAKALGDWLNSPVVKDKACLPEFLKALPVDARTHVVIGPNGGTEDGGLFRSAGVDFGGEPKAGNRYAPMVEANGTDVLNGHHRRLGGEGRPVRIAGTTSPPGFPCTRSQGLEGATHVRLVLISPAIFETDGWLPDGFDSGTLEGEIGKVSLRIYAVALERSASFSGWTATGPGRAWRVVPAGSVYWCEVKGDPNALWNRSLCQPHWAKSGWGHVLVGKVPPQHIV